VNHRDIMCKIIVNTTMRVVKGWTRDANRMGPSLTLYLVIPEWLYVDAAKERDEIQSEIMP
jgi:hypothetical protein